MQAEWIRQSEGFIIVYSIIDKASFESVDAFHENIINYKNEDNSDDKVPMVLAANKCDLEENREVDMATGQAKAEKWGCALLECSAKSNLNVQEVFAKCVEAIVEVFFFFFFLFVCLFVCFFVCLRGFVCLIWFGLV